MTESDKTDGQECSPKARAGTDPGATVVGVSSRCNVFHWGPVRHAGEGVDASLEKTDLRKYKNVHP